MPVKRWSPMSQETREALTGVAQALEVGAARYRDPHISGALECVAREIRDMLSGHRPIVSDEQRRLR